MSTLLDHAVSEQVTSEANRIAHPIVTSSSYLTLHYRLSIRGGKEIMSTFCGNPATLQLGTGQLAPTLEQQLVGLSEGAHHIFELTADQAYGPRNPDLLQPVSLKVLQENSALNEQYETGDLVEFAAPSGGKFAGVLTPRVDAESAWFDFNHPLAGQEIIFEVKIIGIL